ncbi:phage tail protein [Mesorhizobium sp. M0078]|uniref:phage tail protein n=1 Tax=Mesorhizobium sp. M0078 TaxID=2956871 RepID=UPI00333B4828
MPFLVPIFAAAGSALAGISSWLGASTILSGVARFGLGLAAKYALGALMAPKPQAQASQLDTTYGEDLARTVALGTVATPGQHIYRNAYGSGNRHVQDARILSHFRVTGINRVRYNGAWADLETATDALLGHRIDGAEVDIYVNLNIGTMDQAADAGLIAKANPNTRWTSNHRGAGIAYAAVMTRLDRVKQTTPWDAFFEIQGAPLYDWRKDSSVGGSGSHRWDDQDTWEFSENPVLMMYALERGIFNGAEMMVGKGAPASRLPLAEWTLAANICDEGVGDGPRYTAGLIAAAGSGVTHDQNMQPLLEACAATWVEDASGEYPIVGAAQSTVLSFTDNDIMVDEPFRFSVFRTKSELINTLAGTYLDPDGFYEQTPFAVRIDAAALAEDGERLAVSIPYRAVNRSDVADRLADIAFKASRFQANGEICIHPKYLADAKVGRWVEWVSAEYGTRVFQILEKRLGPFGDRASRNIYLTLHEVGDTIFDATDYVTIPTIPALPGDPDYATTAANFLAAGIQLQVSGSTERKPAIRFTWNAFDDVTVTAVEVEYRPTGQTDSIINHADIPLQVLVVSDGVLASTEYEYRYRILTSPPRATFFTGWNTVTTPAASIPDVSVGLAQIQADMRAFFVSISASLQDYRERLAALAASSIDAAGRTAADNSVARRFRDATAAAQLELEASVDEINGELVAQASAILGVTASVGLISADGLFQLVATAGSGDVTSRMIAQVRATTGDAWVDAGYVMEAGFTGGNPLLPFSRFVIKADQFVVTDGTNSGTPLTFEGGVLKLQVANIGTVVAGLMQNAANTMQIDLTNGFISIQVP